MIADNPFLGPEWEPLAQVLGCLLDDLGEHEFLFQVQTYLHSYGLSPSTSPYCQALDRGDGGLHLELSGNINLDPLLTPSQEQFLEFSGWTPPEVAPNVFRETHEGEPNYTRYYAPGYQSIDVAEFILTCWVAVFDMTLDDFIGVQSASVASRIAGLRKLGRLNIDAKHNPEGVIFAMPGRHKDMVGA